MTSRNDVASAAAAFLNAPCGLLAVTPAGRISLANDVFAQWVGHERTELVGMAFASFLDPSSRLFYETRHAHALHLDGHVSEVALSLRARDGATLPVLLSAVVDASEDSLVRIAVFSASGRIAYEEDLLRARREAEASEERLQILQSVSRAFEDSDADHDVAESFAAAARAAFAAADAAVHLFDDDGELRLVAGDNPLVGRVTPIDDLRYPDHEIVMTVHEANTVYPQLADGLRAVHREAISVLPLIADGVRLGVLVCLYGRARAFDDRFYELQRALGRQAAQTLMRVRLQRRLEYLALHDPLTQIANRQLVELSLAAALREAEATSHPLAVIFLDLDNFKAVNDNFGHAGGDEVLRIVGRRLTRAVRAQDTVGRLGGDEFVAVCAVAGADEASLIAERIREAMHEPIRTATIETEISVSVGVALHDPVGGLSLTDDQLLRRADAAMYLSKDLGRDRVSFDGALA